MVKIKGTVQIVFLVAVAVVFSGCAGNSKIKAGPKDRTAKKNLSQIQMVSAQNEGSLWEENNPQSLFVYDTKARGINDIVVVNVVENVKASSSADTDLKRSSTTDLKLSDLFSFLAPVTGIGIKGVNPNLVKSDPSTSSLSTSTQNDYKGEGATTRDGSIIASISVTIMDVLDNGNFYVEGKRDLKINNEKQYLYLKGVIRPQDISPDNTIPSTLVADAQIELSGYGVVAEKQRPGWLARVLDYILPF
jgi:flagellar L-ring protein precursor FlgH